MNNYLLESIDSLSIEKNREELINNNKFKEATISFYDLEEVPLENALECYCRQSTLRMGNLLKAEGKRGWQDTLRAGDLLKAEGKRGWQDTLRACDLLKAEGKRDKQSTLRVRDLLNELLINEMLLSQECDIVSLGHGRKLYTIMQYVLIVA